MKAILQFLTLIAILCASRMSILASEGAEAPSKTSLIGPLWTSETMVPYPEGYVPPDSIDHLPLATPTKGLLFPESLKRRGFIGFFGGYAVFAADGSLAEAQATPGTSYNLHEAAVEFVRNWKWTPPMKDGKPVATIVKFDFIVTEQRTYGPFIEDAGKTPNQSVETTPVSAPHRPPRLTSDVGQTKY